MAADSSATANVPTTAHRPALGKPDLSTPQSYLYLSLLVYRWLSLLPALWVLLTEATRTDLGILPLLLFVIAVGVTLLITLRYYLSAPSIVETPSSVGADSLCAALLLLLSGLTHSPYIAYALSPLLAGAFLFKMRGGLLALAGFSAFYLLAILLTYQAQASSVGMIDLTVQLAGIWFITILAAALSEWKQLQQAHQKLVAAHTELTEQNSQLATAHYQLGVIHELTLFLQEASDSPSVQRRLLKAVTEELGFSRALVGLINPSLQRLEQWLAKPPFGDGSPATMPLLLTPEHGLIAQAVLERQVRWASDDELLLAEKGLKRWLGQSNWLILPVIWQEKTVGVLLVAVETEDRVDISDDRWAILTALVSQAAVALITLDRTRGLAVEKERNRIARDIHDTVAQSLFGIAFTLDACIKLLPGQAEMVRQELIELRTIADRVRQEVRQSILDIWPSDLTEEKFKTDLRKYVAHTAPDHVFQVDFMVEGDFNGLPAIIRRSLYRVSQEALANAARHAGVDTARVYLYVEPEEVYLSIRDKGRGFEPKSALARERNRERFGLRGMQERIKVLDGTCDILSQVNQGTQVLVRVPIKEGECHA